MFGRAQYYQHLYENLKCLAGFIKSYGTTDFLMNEMSSNVQDVLGVLYLTFLQNLKDL